MGQTLGATMNDRRYLTLTAVGVIAFGTSAFYVVKLPAYVITRGNASIAQSILASICASFVFLFTLDAGSLLRERFHIKRFRAFFGDLSLSATSCLVYPDFVLSDRCRELLKDMPKTQLFRKQADQYPGTRFIDVPRIVASNDLQAIVIVATKLGRYLRDSPLLITDGQAVADGSKSLISFGLTSNAVTDLYLNSDPQPLFTIEDPGGEPALAVKVNGQKQYYGRTADYQHGVILRYRPDPKDYPGKTWIICAGLAAAGTPAAAWNLVHRWRDYQRRFGSRDFAIIFKTSNDIYSYVSSTEVCALSR
jgi:hypothetical protein